MITALILCRRGDKGDEEVTEALAATLSSLVPGVAQGLIGDAVVMPESSSERLARVADAAGATLIALASGDDPWAMGSALARRDWCLCLEAGDIPGEGWIRALERFTGLARPDADGRVQRPHARLLRTSLGLARRWQPLLETLRLQRVRVGAGDLVAKSLLRSPRRPLRPPVHLAVPLERYDR